MQVVRQDADRDGLDFLLAPDLAHRFGSDGIAAAERAELTGRVESLRGEQQGQASDRRSKEAALASTPVRFSYSTPSLLSGGNTFGKAAAASWGSLESAIAFALLLAGVALPWIGLIALLVLGWRWIKRRSPGASPSPMEPTPTP